MAESRQKECNPGNCQEPFSMLNNTTCHVESQKMSPAHTSPSVHGVVWCVLCAVCCVLCGITKCRVLCGMHCVLCIVCCMFCDMCLPMGEETHRTNQDWACNSDWVCQQPTVQHNISRHTLQSPKAIVSMATCPSVRGVPPPPPRIMHNIQRSCPPWVGGGGGAAVEQTTGPAVGNIKGERLPMGDTISGTPGTQPPSQARGSNSTCYRHPSLRLDPASLPTRTTC